MHPPPPHPGSPSSPGLILLVEDNEVYRQVTAMALRQYLPGAEVVEASSVAAALHVLGSQPITAMIVDMTLPDGTAVDLLKKAQSTLRTGVKVIVFSNHSKDDMTPVLRLAGVHGYVEKSQGLKALALAVQAALQDESGTSPESH